MRINHIKRYFLFVLTLLFLLLSLGGVFALVSIQPASTQVNGCAGTNVNVNVSLSNVANVYGIQFDLNYNQNILNFINFTTRGFVAYSYSNYTPTPGSIKNIIATQVGNSSPGVSAGVIAVIFFGVRNQSSYPATSNLVLANVKLSNKNSQPLDNSTQSGSVTVNACPCTNGQTRSCTANNSCTGTQTCTGGAWGSCTTTLNRCDSNCDGTNDSCVTGSCPTCDCIGYGSRDCYNTPGGCRGRQNCTGGHWTSCSPVQNYCDTDCNGVNDTCRNSSCVACNCITGQARSCTAGNGCSGNQTCSGGNWGSCITSLYRCDANCDGVNDTCSSSPCAACNCINGQRRSCTAGNGCSGNQTCIGGVWGSCTTSLYRCDANCDGVNDTCSSSPCAACACVTGQTRSCTAGNGCSGTQTCSGGTWGQCSTTQNRCDSNCDGVNDTCSSSPCVTCNCLTGQTRTCTAANSCSGSQTCSGGVWGSCTTSLYRCDVNCDGVNDTCSSSPCAACNCISGQSRSCTAGNGCSGTQTCNSGVWGSCSTSQNRCDNNCDGVNDTCSSSPCAACNCITGQSRSCTAANSCTGSQSCSNGNWSTCVTGLNYCDVNCNGTSVCTSSSCPACQCTGSVLRNCTTPVGCAGRQQCSGGVWGSCTIIGYYCDNNCDGVNDTCSSASCRTCNCLAGANRGCVAGNSCSGMQTCVNGSWGSCTTSLYRCDANCDGVNDTCSSSPCAACACITGQTRSCTAGNGCSGSQTCSGGVWGSCVSSQYYCDVNCDGVNDTCSSSPCVACACITGQTRTCTAANSCSGSQTCSGGVWGSCVSSQYRCDVNCDGVNDTCSSSPCVICACITGQTRTCTAANSCSGSQTCSGGAWSSCATGLNYCDVNCNGTSVCTSSSCPTCQCTGSVLRNCTTPVGCAGRQQCSGGTWGSCTIIGYYCDANCNGTSICTSNTCPTCQCTGSGSRSCTAGNGCVGSQSCSGGVWSSCVSSQYYCDNNCDGTNDTCSNASCQVCNCLSGASKGCLTSDGCTGTQSCVNGNWGACTSSQFFCDMNCDSTKECSDANCSVCCVEDWDCDAWSTCSDGTQTRSCSDLNACGTNNNRPSESRSCTPEGSGGGGDGGGGGGGALPSSCVENWTCQIWGACDADGMRRRTCTDANNCGTSSAKPQELETCLYEGNCQDGIMNGDEQNIDCGGRCSNACSGEIIANPPQLNIFTISALSGEVIDTLNGEILDNYVLEVGIENLGDKEVNNLEVAANKWSEERVHIDSILPGMTEKSTILLNLPGDPYENSLEIQVSQNNNLVSTKSIPVVLSVPQFSLKIGRDSKTGKTYQALLVDNRNKPARHVEVDFSVNKNQETYLFETDQAYDIAENELFHRVDYLYQNLPSGKYEINSVLYEQGQQVDEATSFVILSGGSKGFNIKYLFYFLLLVLVCISGYVFFMSQKK